MAGLRRVRLDELSVQLGNGMVVGLLIAKSSPRVMRPQMGGREPREPRAVWNFTLRDSPVDTINCSVWGSPHFVFSFDQMFHVGNVVDVMSPRIKTRQLDDRNEQYLPQVSSPFHLILNERQSEMSIHEGDNYVEYLPLLHIPTKPAAGFYTLADIQNNSQDIREESVDLLVAIRGIFPIRTIKTKDGMEIQNREISAFDQTTTSPIKIVFWDEETIKRAGLWKIRETILFISDVKLEWSDYNKAIIGRTFFRTIVTEDPHTKEADELRKFVANSPLQRTAVVEGIAQNIPDLNSIRNVMTAQQILDRANLEENSQFTALMYATVTHLDLDGHSKLTITNCGGCGNFLRSPHFICENTNCSSVMSDLLGQQTSFDIRVTITDHTGSLSNCRLGGKYAENILGCNIDNFMSMDENSKGLLKWKLLMERCTVRLIVMKGPLISILSCTVSDPNEVISKLPVY